MTHLEEVRKELARKEQELKARLNESSEEVESSLFKVLKIAAIGGLAGLIIYKAISPSKKKRARKSDELEKENTETTEGIQQPKNPSTADVISRNLLVEIGIKTLLPMGLKLLKSVLEKRVESTNEDSEER